jgi:hypothetical protein
VFSACQSVFTALCHVMYSPGSALLEILSGIACIHVAVERCLARVITSFVLWPYMNNLEQNVLAFLVETIANYYTFV